jgi:hypothetical protein
MSSDHHFTINGAKWLWRYARLRGAAAGWAYLPDHKNPKLEKKILVDERLTGRSRLETELHEFCHAANPTKSEEAVTQEAKELARILWSLGYRLKDQ